MTKPTKLIRGPGDTFWRPSCRDGYTQYDAMKDMFVRGGVYFFREVRRIPKRWWWPLERWTDTGRTVESRGEFPQGFRLITD